MKMRILPIAGLATLALLGACKPEPKILDSRAPDPLAAEKAKAPKAVLPPPIKSSATFRCKDNSLVYIDFFEGDTLLNLRTVKDGVPTQLKAEAAGKPFTGGGFTVTGNDKGIMLTAPDKGEQSCRV